MSSMKGRIFALAAMAMAFSGDNFGRSRIYEARTPPTPEELKAKQAEINRRRGLKLFTFGTTEIWAINESVAEKKFKKLLTKTQ